MYLLAIIILVADERREKFGGIAQLGERLNGIQEVSGSIPLISTKSTNRKVGAFFFAVMGLRAVSCTETACFLYLPPSARFQNEVGQGSFYRVFSRLHWISFVPYGTLYATHYSKGDWVDG